MKNQKWLIVHALFIFTTGILLLTGCEKEKYEKSQNDNEQEVTIHQVPAAVKATIQKENSGKVPSEIEMLTKNGNTVYTATIAKNGKEHEIYISEDGTILSSAGEDQEAEDDDRADKD